jgi:hypothetical protein
VTPADSLHSSSSIKSKRAISEACGGGVRRASPLNWGHATMLCVTALSRYAGCKMAPEAA